MNATTRQSLEDFKVPVKLKLSALWTAIMFCYIYGDFWGLYRPGNLKGLLDGDGPLGPTSQGTLVAVAILVAIPALMIFASLVLAPTLNRWANIVLAAALTIIIAMTLPGAWSFYILFSIIEMALRVLIIGYAWRWPRKAADPQGSLRDATTTAASPLSTRRRMARRTFTFSVVSPANIDSCYFSWMPPFVSATGSSSFFNSAFDKPVVSSATSMIGRFSL